MEEKELWEYGLLNSSNYLYSYQSPHNVYTLVWVIEVEATLVQEFAVC